MSSADTEPFTTEDVDRALDRLQRVHDGHMNAIKMWEPMLKSLQSTRNSQRYE